ncbi:MAG: GGDEF domain-containing protein [Thalassotalea sp.]|nr:GGDEF domain-containing protein [Thalassotalea sp.]
MNNAIVLKLILLFLIFFSGKLFAEEQLNKAATLSDIAQPTQSNLLNSDEPLPIDAKLISLLELSENDPISAEKILPNIVDISDNFNVAEKYLMFIIRANLVSENNEAHKAINWLKKALLLEDKIAHVQLIQPQFNQLHLNLAKSYAQISQFKLAYEQKNLYLDKYRDYRKLLREERLIKLNAKYETDLKVKANELLKTEHEYQTLQLAEAAKEAKTQHRNIVILIITAIIFIALLVRQLKIRATLKRISKRDSLTQLFNRRTLFKQGEIHIESALKHQHDLSVILLDIDYFKQVNDHYGHNVGDEVIKAIANLGGETIRPRDILTRLGGEEFAVILPETSHEQAKAIAERFREKVEQYDLSHFGENLKITVSIGVANLAQTQQNFDALLTAADEAMYLAKNAGRNQVCSYLGAVELSV